MAPSSAEPSSAFLPQGRELLVCIAAAAVVLLSRLAHVDLVWIEEAYGLTAARELLQGQGLYRDIWFDKPPGYAHYYSLFGAQTGIALRLAGTAFVLITAGAAALAAKKLWSDRERTPAFVFVCLALTFWIPSAVQAVTPDLLSVPLLLAALALYRLPALAGVLAGLAFWCNTKALILTLPLLLWFNGIGSVLQFGAGWSAVGATELLILDARAYWQQVWVWGFGYSRDSFVQSPATEFFRRTAGWAWFHAGALLVAVRAARHEVRLLIWFAVALASVCLGSRFFPRYYFALLPPLVLLAARGWSISGKTLRIGALLLCAIPIVRFGPRHVTLFTEPNASWTDLNLMEDSRSVAGILSAEAKPEARILVWGYRPDVYAFSGLRPAPRFIDSQPLTGVLADRHLTNSRPTFAELAQVHRRELASAPRPDFIVDGLGLLNPDLGINSYEELRSLLADYRVVTKTSSSVIYQLHPAVRH